MPDDVHFICRQGDGHRMVDREQGTWESGDWNVSDGSADRLIGGRLYLHERQDERAWHGGTIESWRPVEGVPGRKIFTYRVDGPFRITHREGWAQEVAYVRR